MNEMTLPSRHRIQNSNSGGLRSSTLPVTGAPHNIESFTSERGRNVFFFFFKLEGKSEARTRDFRLSKQSALTTAQEISVTVWSSPVTK